MDLAFILKENVLKATQFIDIDNIPSNHPRSDYWIVIKGNRYPFKYLVEEAGILAGRKNFTSNDFKSDTPERNYIASLGFNIRYYKFSGKENSRYWAGAYYWGENDNNNKLKEFIKNGWWGTDHYTTSKSGRIIFNRVRQMEVNDRIVLRTLDRKKSIIKIEAIGTISNTDKSGEGWVKVVWDLNPFLYHGKKPMGRGSGAWWNTLSEVQRDEDVKMIFNESIILEKISRVCWNTNGWIKPSGWIGKSKNLETHEANYGYGHEEWLLDIDKIYNGYHYGFLQPIHQNKDLYSGKVFNISLYSIDGVSKKRHWIGRIKNVEIIDNRASSKVVEYYSWKGWLDEMFNQVKEVEADEKSFKQWMNETLFNVKFKSDDLDLLDNPLELSKNDSAISYPRYVLLNKINEPAFETEDDGKFIFKPQKPSNNVNYNSSYQSKAKNVELELKHKEIIDGLYKILSEKYGAKNVSAELETGFGTRMDIVVQSGSGLIIYEIKTYNSIKSNIREALGQLIEYSYWPNKELAKELIIVSHLKATESVKKYMILLRTKLKLPILYQAFDTEKGELSLKC